MSVQTCVRKHSTIQAQASLPSIGVTVLDGKAAAQAMETPSQRDCDGHKKLL